MDLYIGPDETYVDDAEKVFDFVARHRTMRIDEQFRALVDTGEIDIVAAREAGIGQRTINRLARVLGAEVESEGKLTLLIVANGRK